jgi:hypothetical protein
MGMSGYRMATPAEREMARQKRSEGNRLAQEAWARDKERTMSMFWHDIPPSPPPLRGAPFTDEEIALALETAAVGRVGEGSVWMDRRVRHLQRRGLVRVDIVSRHFADVSLTPEAEAWRKAQEALGITPAAAPRPAGDES